jgi:hypothetical protein
VKNTRLCRAMHSSGRAVKHSNVIFNTKPVSEGFSSVLGLTLRSTKACFVTWNVTALRFATFDSVFVHKQENALVGNA